MRRHLMRRYLCLISVVLMVGIWGWSQYVDRARAPAQLPDTSRHTSQPTSPQRQEASPNGTVSGTSVDSPAGTAGSVAYPGFLPAQAHDVLRRIAAGGPFDHRQDGSTFQNRENRLPRQPRGYYREYTVETPGSGDRGARRIVTGGDPPSEYFYSDDHYRSFRRFDGGAR